MNEAPVSSLDNNQKNRFQKHAVIFHEQEGNFAQTENL
jgi:hypothetical protein